MSFSVTLWHWNCESPSVLLVSSSANLKFLALTVLPKDEHVGTQRRSFICRQRPRHWTRSEHWGPVGNMHRPHTHTHTHNDALHKLISTLVNAVVAVHMHAHTTKSHTRQIKYIRTWENTHVHNTHTHSSSSSSFQLFSKCWLHKTPGGASSLLLPPPQSGSRAIPPQGGWAGPADPRCSVTRGWGSREGRGPGPSWLGSSSPFSFLPSAVWAAHLRMGRDSNGPGTTGRKNIKIKKS